jgi:hypothetical protein
MGRKARTMTTRPSIDAAVDPSVDKAADAEIEPAVDAAVEQGADGARRSRVARAASPSIEETHAKLAREYLFVWGEKKRTTTTNDGRRQI